MEETWQDHKESHVHTHTLHRLSFFCEGHLTFGSNTHTRTKHTRKQNFPFFPPTT